MLRNLVLAAAMGATAIGALLLAAGVPAFGLVGMGVLLCVGTLFERVRYKRLEAAPREARFTATSERFMDEATGVPVTVWTDLKTGERKYVRD